MDGAAMRTKPTKLVLNASRRAGLAACAAAALVLGLRAGVVARADAPRVYAITGARLVTAVGPPIEAGTIVLREGVIQAVGPSVSVPADAWVIDGKGLTVYPGLIDLGTSVPVDSPRAQPPQNPATTEELERWKRGAILRPHFLAADHIKTDAAEVHWFAAAGITSVLAVPDGGVFAGQSALVNVVPPEDEPQIGAPADPRGGLLVLKTPVALHVALGARLPGGGYPNSLMGVIAFARQAWLDAEHYRLAGQAWWRKPAAVERPAHDAALEALWPALDRRVPVAFEARLDRDIRRALRMAADFTLDPIVTGALEADQVAAELKAAGARVIYSLDYPTRPRTLAPDADEPLRVLRQRANAPKVPAALERAGVRFAFQSGGLRDPKDFVRHAARAVKDGLSPEAAVRALTIDAARIAGVADRLGSLEPGKIANLVVTDGDLFADQTKIRYVFVDGRRVRLDEAPAGGRGQRPGRSGS
jgi:imidazolonepropionase-like amidohydrolase